MDGQWYGYDDSSVEPVPEGEVCTRGAYILFYQRRNSIPAWSASCSLRGQKSSPSSAYSRKSQLLKLTVPVFAIFRLTKHEFDYANTPKVKLMNNENVGYICACLFSKELSQYTILMNRD